MRLKNLWSASIEPLTGSVKNTATRSIWQQLSFWKSCSHDLQMNKKKKARTFDGLSLSPFMGGIMIERE